MIVKEFLCVVMICLTGWAAASIYSIDFSQIDPQAQNAEMLEDISRLIEFWGSSE